MRFPMPFFSHGHLLDVVFLHVSPGPLRFGIVSSDSTLVRLQHSQVPRKGQGQNYYHRFQLLSDSRAPQAGLSQIQEPILLFPLPAEAQL